MASHSIGSLQGGENGFNLTMNVMEILTSLNSLVWITQSLLVNTQKFQASFLPVSDSTMM